jgi:tRNA dimethylallyltransferase
VGGWLKAARHVIGEVAERGQVPLVVGGPGLYLASLVLGYDPPPTGDESSVRASLQARLEGEGLGPLVRELVERDPNAGQVVDINNPRRVIRALEVIEITGQAFSTRGRQASPYPAVVVALDPPRAELDARVVARTHAMFEGGIQAETERAVAEGAGEGSPGFSGIGYPQALQLLRGEIDLDTAVEATVRATRILVRRQRNWLKRFPVALRLETWSEDEAVTSITRVWDERRGALVS